jgi:hypothetical protein
MQDKWYSDNRDILKWSVLLTIGEQNKAKRILQIAYYRPSTFPQIEVDKKKYQIPDQVIAHFRDVRSVNKLASTIHINVFDNLFDNRAEYLEAVKNYIKSFEQEKCVLFLDPDTGLQPNNLKPEHVSNTEVKAIWAATKIGDTFAFYQHQTNRNGQEWIEPKRIQLAGALGVATNIVKVAKSNALARDVVLIFAAKA